MQACDRNVDALDARPAERGRRESAVRETRGDAGIDDGEHRRDDESKAGHAEKMRFTSFAGRVEETQVNPPSAFISSAALRTAANASRDSAPPTLMRLTPASASCAVVSAGSAALMTTLTGLCTAAVTVRIVARSRNPGAYSTSAPAFSNACKRRMMSSRSRACIKP